MERRQHLPSQPGQPFLQVFPSLISLRPTTSSLVARASRKLIRDIKGCLSKAFQSDLNPCNPVKRQVRFQF
jgi:hypothetical protein